MGDLFVVSSSPHTHSGINTSRAVYIVCLGLLPSLIFGIFNFGLYVLFVVMVSVLSSVVFEMITEYLTKRQITIHDGTALLTGLLLGMSLPPGVALWIPIIGAGFSIILVKQMFGGMGFNFLNPALTGRAVLLFAFPAIMTTAWRAPFYGTISGIDTLTQATPLTILKNPGYYGDAGVIINKFNTFNFLKILFFGNIGGSIGETCKLTIILGGLVLLFLKIIDYRIVVNYLLSFLLLSVVLPHKVNPIFYLFSGGVLLTIFFMATDWVTTPITKSGRWIFGIGCGVFTVLFRLFSPFSEGVTPAILLMNLFTPFIDKITMKRRLRQ